MDEQTVNKMARYLATEHSALQAARSAIAVEASGRTASFLTTISAAVVALTLVFQISRFGEVFFLFALALISILGFIGLSAYVRMVQLDFADVVYTLAINRIRHFYLHTAPEIAPYLSLPAFDDERSILKARVIYTGLAWTVLSYPSGLILVINSVLAGALCSLLVTTLFHAHLLIVAGAGLLIFVLASLLQYRLGLTWYAAVRADFQPRFPDPGHSSRAPV